MGILAFGKEPLCERLKIPSHLPGGQKEIKAADSRELGGISYSHPLVGAGFGLFKAHLKCMSMMYLISAIHRSTGRGVTYDLYIPSI